MLNPEIDQTPTQMNLGVSVSGGIMTRIRPYPESSVAWDEAFRQRQRADDLEEFLRRIAETCRHLAKSRPGGSLMRVVTEIETKLTMG